MRRADARRDHVRDGRGASGALPQVLERWARSGSSRGQVRLRACRRICGRTCSAPVPWPGVRAPRSVDARDAAASSEMSPSASGAVLDDAAHWPTDGRVDPG